MKHSDLDTPVLLLIFNRPDTTARVFASIRTARPTRLYVAADGPRDHVQGEKDLCFSARAAAVGVDWPCQVKTLFREQNLGPRNAVNSSLDWFFANEDEGIILEDDCLPDQSFFGFANELLARYRTDDRVAMICGTNYLLDRLKIDTSYCFSRYYSIWGWASWKRVWEAHDKSMKRWQEMRSTRWLEEFYRQGFMRRHVQKTFDLVSAGAIDTWDIQLTFSCLLARRLAVVPHVNLISNIGIAGTHTSGDRRNFNLPRYSLREEPLVHPAAIQPEPRYDEVFFRREFGHHPLRWTVRTTSRIARWSRRMLIGPKG